LRQIVQTVVTIRCEQFRVMLRDGPIVDLNGVIGPRPMVMRSPSGHGDLHRTVGGRTDAGMQVITRLSAGAISTAWRRTDVPESEKGGE
jgi:hypothetical protein